MPKPATGFMTKARRWAAKNKLLGPQAFLKYVILTFVEEINAVTDDMIFKGGNLLWIYTHTPRATVDLDLATLSANAHDDVRAILTKACEHSHDIAFSITQFDEVKTQGKSGAAVIIQYKTDQGASNSFQVDIVYALPMDTTRIPSPINETHLVSVVTIENIIADKLAAAHRFKSGNTRIKDYDDLYRIAISNPAINHEALTRLLASQQTAPHLDEDWISPAMEQAWKNHVKRYADLPADLRNVFREINAWVSKIQNIKKGTT